MSEVASVSPNCTPTFKEKSIFAADRRPFLVVVVSGLPGIVVIVFTRIIEQGRTEAVILVVERAGIGEILDLAEHLDAHPPMLGEVVFGTPAIFETEPGRVPVLAHLTGEKRD